MPTETMGPSGLTPVFRAKYVLESELGKGGMGAVYLALDRRLERRVAMKFLLSGDAESRARFAREARTLAKVQHPNVTMVFEVDEDGGIPYLVSELVEGESLQARVKRMRQLPADEALRIAAGIATGLDRVHALGIVHRDLKSANVLVAADGTPKICDFGLARQDRDAAVTQQGMITGTPEYMAPELVNDGTCTASADLYALGCILFEMVAGRVPFPAQLPDGTTRSTFDVLRAQVDEEPPPLSAVAPGAPAPLGALVARCLAKAPGDRPASAAALAEELAALETRFRGRPSTRVRVGSAAPGASGVVSAAKTEAMPAPSRPQRTTGRAPAVRVTSKVAAAAPSPANRAPLIAGAVALVALLVAGGLAMRRPARPVPGASPSPSPSIAAAARLSDEERAAMSARVRVALKQAAPTKAADREELGTLVAQGDEVAAEMCALVAERLDAPAREDDDAVLRTAARALGAELGPLKRALEGRARAPSPYCTPLKARVLVARAHALAGRVPTAKTLAWKLYEGATDRVEAVALLFELGEKPRLAERAVYLSEPDGAQMVWVPPGEFTQGATKKDGDAEDEERPHHNVWLSGYFIDRCEVSVAQYARFLKWIEKTRDHSRCDREAACRRPVPRYEHLVTSELPSEMSSVFGNPKDKLQTLPADLVAPGDQFNGKYDRQPITAVCWYDARAYLRWAGKELPTEAQWEKAARGTDERRYPWGDAKPTHRLANFGDETHGALAPVTEYAAGESPYGALNLAGNALEWCRDWYDRDYYRAQKKGLPRNPAGPSSGKERVQRGGAIYRNHKNMRCTWRAQARPDVGKIGKWGFRGVRELGSLVGDEPGTGR